MTTTSRPSDTLARGLRAARRVLSRTTSTPQTASEILSDVMDLAEAWSDLDRSLRCGGAFPGPWCAWDTSRALNDPRIEHAYRKGIDLARLIMNETDSPLTMRDALNLARELVFLDLEFRGGAAFPSPWQGAPGRLIDARPGRALRQ